MSYSLFSRFLPNRLCATFRMTRSTRRISSLISLRGELARQTLIEIGRRIAGAAPILLGVLGSVLLGVLALMVVPLLYSVTSPVFDGLAIFAAHTLIVSLPLFIVRQRVLPESFLNWSAGLPVGRWHRMVGDAWATAVFLAPLAGAYTVSSLIWVWQWPLWLRSAWLPAFASVLLSLFFNWLFGMLVLNWRWRADRAHRTGAAKKGASLPGHVPRAPVGLYARELALAHKLLCLSQWRQKSALWHAGQLMLIVLIGAGGIGVLLKSNAPAWHAAIAPCLALLLVGMTLWRDAAMRFNLSHLMHAMAAWPIEFVRLQRVGMLWAILPALGLSLGLLSALAFGLSTNAVGSLLWFSGLTAVGAPMMLFLTKIDTRGRWATAAVWLAALVISGDKL